jgi:hypothetical protein
LTCAALTWVWQLSGDGRVWRAGSLPPRPLTRILGSVADEPTRPRLDLGADRGDVVFGLALFSVLLVFAAITADIETAVGLLIFVAVAFGCLAVIVALVRRSLMRGLSDAARWTFGFVGRWFSFW